MAELDMQIWFEGMGRRREDVDALARQKAFEMARLVAKHEYSGIGKHVQKPNGKPAVDRLHELTMPALVIVGENDLPFLRLAADYMVERLPNAQKVVIPNAAHLPNMEHPELFGARVADFFTKV